ETDQFGVDGRTTRLGMLQLLEHQRTGTVGQHETVTPLVPWATRCRRVVIASGQGTGGSETTDPQTAGSHFRATGDHHVRLAVGDVAGGHADAMCTGGTGGGDGVI